MQIYQDLNDYEKATVRRRGLALLGLLSVFVFVLTVSYGVQVWRDVKDVIGGSKKLEVTLNGEGKVTAKPDVAKINITILTQKKSVREAQEENAAKSRGVAEYLKKQGVEEKDIKTVGYNIYPQYSYPRPCYGEICAIEDRQTKIIGYEVRNSYEVTVRSIGKSGDILSGVVEAGANEVGGIFFTIDKPENLQDNARTKAIDNAREKAEKLAKNLGKRVGRIVAFSESGSSPVFFKEMALGGRGGDGGGAATPSVEPGENEVVVNVTVTYEFK